MSGWFHNEVNFMIMGLKNELLKYLSVAKKDANSRDKSLLSELRLVFYRKKILDTAVFARKIARFIDLLFYHMPELQRADPKHIKIQPLCQYCVRLAESNHRRQQHRHKR
jgi:hypothetical protein